MHYAYVTTDLTNGMKYIGQRKCPKNTTPEKDSYLGSGTRLLNAINKRGRKFFKKEIIATSNSQYEIDNIEIQLIKKHDAVNNPNFYNLAYGGQFWREGQSEYMSKKMKEFYSLPENREKLAKANKIKFNNNYCEKWNIPRGQADRHRLYRQHIESLNQKIKKCKKQIKNKEKEILRQKKKKWNKTPIAKFIRAQSFVGNYSGVRSFKQKMEDDAYRNEFRRKVSEGNKGRIISQDTRLIHSQNYVKEVTPIHDFIFSKEKTISDFSSTFKNNLRSFSSGGHGYIKFFNKAYSVFYKELLPLGFSIKYKDLLIWYENKNGKLKRHRAYPKTKKGSQYKYESKITSILKKNDVKIKDRELYFKYINLFRRRKNNYYQVAEVVNGFYGYCLREHNIKIDRTECTSDLWALLEKSLSWKPKSDALKNYDWVIDKIQYISILTNSKGRSEMKLVTQAELARMAGISRAAVADAIKKEKTPFVQDGKKKKIDVDSTEIKYYLSGNRQRSAVHGEKKEVKTKNNKVFSQKDTVPPQEIHDIIPKDNSETILDGIPDHLKVMTKHDLDRMKTAVQIQKDKLKHDQERELYIDRTVVKRAFMALYQIDTEEFLQLSHTLSARICQDVFGTSDPEKMTKLSKLLDTDFYKVQNHIRITLNRHLEQMGLEAVG